MRHELEEHHAAYKELRRYINATDFPEIGRLSALVAKFTAVREQLENRSKGD